jgi:ferredoxin/flavodoxin---NADP+ reductase
MCGGCRVLIDGKSEFACVDGPEFDAHKVDFSVLVQRNSMYREAEQRSLAQYQSTKHTEHEACTVTTARQGDQR